jgi:hypothetical protein
MSHDQIGAMVENMEKECKDIRREAIKMTWYMRGGLDYVQALTLSARERELVGELIKDNLETTKKSGLPFF